MQKKMFTMIVICLLSMGFVNSNAESSKKDNTKEVVSKYVEKTFLNSYDKKVKVRLTVYWKNGSGTDYYTSKGISYTGERLVDKKSAASDPKVIPMGSKVFIPSLNISVKVHDIGTDVIKRTASKKDGRNNPVLDLFFKNKSEALKFASENPQYVMAYVRL